MMYSKNNNGFTLIEVLISLLIMGLLMSSLFVSETLVVRTVSIFSQHLRRVLQAKKFLYTVQMSEEKKEDKSESKRKEEVVKEAAFTTHLLYEQDPAKIASLKGFKDIVVQRVKIEWQEGRTRRSDELVTFAFKPTKPKKKA